MRLNGAWFLLIAKSRRITHIYSILKNDKQCLNKRCIFCDHNKEFAKEYVERITVGRIRLRPTSQSTSQSISRLIKFVHFGWNRIKAVFHQKQLNSVDCSRNLQLLGRTILVTSGKSHFRLITIIFSNYFKLKL